MPRVLYGLLKFAVCDGYSPLHLRISLSRLCGDWEHSYNSRGFLHFREFRRGIFRHTRGNATTGEISSPWSASSL